MTTVGATIVISDLVGSTALTTRIGADAADRLRREHFALLRDAVTSHGGREVKNMGDGIMAVFPGVGAAIDGAIAMQQACARRNLSEAETLEIRIGIGTGDCTEEDGDYFGEPPIIAARLCAAALPSQILAPELVRHLAPRGRHEFAPSGDRELKGIPEPVATTSIVWYPAVARRDDPVPLPPRLTVPSAIGFVGRDAERAQIDAAWRAAAAGSRRVALISGEAGLGKTRLVSELARTAHEQGALVLYGRCDEEVPRQYGPWAEAVEFLGAHSDPETFEGLDVRSLVRLAPGLAARIGADPGTADLDQYVLFAAVADLLVRVASAGPALIVLDDLHWADRGTLVLLRHLVAATAAERILILGTFRDTDVDPNGDLATTVAALHREEGVTRIGLDALSEGDVESLLTSTAGHDLGAAGAELSRALRSETGGNPFFVGEMLRHLVESGAIARGADGRWAAVGDVSAAGMPQSVREVIGARVRRLGDVAVSVLTTAAVCGRDFDLATVAGAMGVADDTVLDALDAATTAGLVGEVVGRVERFTFAHALVQHTLEAELTPTRRARVHRAVADAIERNPAGGSRSAELAVHLFASGRPEDDVRAIPYAVRAGEAAMAAFAPDEAVGWYRRALSAMPADADRGERCALEIRLGEAERRIDDTAFLTRLMDAAAEARALGRDDLLIGAALARYRGFQISGAEVDPEQIGLLQDALTAAGDEDSPARARLMAAIAAERRFSGDPAYVEGSRDAIAIARRTGDLETLVDVLAWSSLDTPASFDERRRIGDEVMRLTERMDDPVRRFWSLVQCMTTWLTDGEIEAARRGATELMVQAQRLGNAQTRWIATLWQIQIANITGDLDTAERLGGEAFTLSLEAGREDGMLYFGSQLMTTRLQQGRWAEILPLLEQAVVDYPRVPGFRSVLAYLHAVSGARGEAERHFGQLRAESFAFPEDQVWMVATALAAHTAHLLDDRGSAALLLERLAPYAGRIAVQTLTTCVGAVSYYLGLLRTTLGERPAAIVDLQDALERSTRFESPYYRAQTMLDLAELTREDDPEGAAVLVAGARELAARHGFGGLAARAGV
ncbi:MAG: ATP-binding protein [Actinomycetes bacterium]